MHERVARLDSLEAIVSLSRTTSCMQVSTGLVGKIIVHLGFLVLVTSLAAPWNLWSEGI